MVKSMGRTFSGFTLIELMVVLAILMLLLTVAAPRYFTGVDRAKEVALKQNPAGGTKRRWCSCHQWWQESAESSRIAVWVHAAWGVIKRGASVRRQVAHAAQ